MISMVIEDYKLMKNTNLLTKILLEKCYTEIIVLGKLV